MDHIQDPYTFEIFNPLDLNLSSSFGKVDNYYFDIVISEPDTASCVFPSQIKSAKNWRLFLLPISVFERLASDKKLLNECIFW